MRPLPSTLVLQPPLTLTQQSPSAVPIDRTRTAPSLLRAVVRHLRHSRPAEYAGADGVPSAADVQALSLYVWPDCTLRDLAALVVEGVVEARRPGARLSLALVFPERSGAYVVNVVGVVQAVGGGTGAGAGPDEAKELRGCGYEPGDYLDVAVM